jgi:hypothetical protein
MWNRWKAGQSLHEIGRALGKSHVVIQFLLARHGGKVVLHRPVEPAPFLGTWPKREKILPTTLPDSLRPGGRAMLQLFATVL